MTITNEEWSAMVNDWQVAFEQPDDLALQITLINEECMELINVFVEYPGPSVEAFAHLFKEVADVLFVMTGFNNMAEHLDIPDGSLTMDQDTMALIMAAEKVAQDIVWDDETSDIMLEAMVLVHASNMSKLGDGGKPLRREDGKIMKGPNYKAPDLTDLATKYYTLFCDKFGYVADNSTDVSEGEFEVAE
jgi:hypothetical protein